MKWLESRKHSGCPVILFEKNGKGCGAQSR